MSRKKPRPGARLRRARGKRERTEAARILLAQRWAKVPPEKRSEIARELSLARRTHAGGRPRSKKKRCPCGAMTRRRAAARAHRCQAPVAAEG